MPDFQSDNYYEVLGVSKDASQKQIKKAYKELAVEYHPDQSDEENAEEIFKEITEAYEVLGDEETRQKYDRFGKEAVQGAASRGGGRGQQFDNIQDLLNEMGFGDIFDMFGGRGRGRGGGRRGRGRSRQGADLKAGIELELEEAAFGTEREIEFNSRDDCEACDGTGSTTGNMTRCSKCDGKGKISESKGFFTMTKTCPECHGQGKMVEDPCDECNGKGTVEEERTVEFEVPAGVQTGHRIRLNGEGRSGPRGSGDLYVEFQVKEHDRFKRKNDDLYTQVPISFIQASLGGTVEVPLLDEDETEQLEVEEGTQSGEVFVIEGKGVPHLNGRGRGDLHVQVKVVTPTDLSDEERECLEQLAELRGEKVQDPDQGIFNRIYDVFSG